MVIVGLLSNVEHQIRKIAFSATQIILYINVDSRFGVPNELYKF